MCFAFIIPSRSAVSAAVALSLSLVLAGCNPSSTSNSSGSPLTKTTGTSTNGSPPAPGEYPPVTAAEIPSLFCNSRAQTREVPDEFEWKFTDTAIEITGPVIPSSLVTAFGLKEPPAKSISASWTLSDGNLTLSSFVVDDQAVELPPVKLHIFKTAPTVWRINVDGEQFVFVRG